jgi:hypothetical protein
MERGCRDVAAAPTPARSVAHPPILRQHADPGARLPAGGRPRVPASTRASTRPTMPLCQRPSIGTQLRPTRVLSGSWPESRCVYDPLSDKVRESTPGDRRRHLRLGTHAREAAVEGRRIRFLHIESIPSSDVLKPERAGEQFGVHPPRGGRHGNRLSESDRTLSPASCPDPLSSRGRLRQGHGRPGRASPACASRRRAPDSAAMRGYLRGRAKTALRRASSPSAAVAESSSLGEQMRAAEPSRQLRQRVLRNPWL